MIKLSPIPGTSLTLYLKLLIERHEKHPSVLKIKNNSKTKETFNFLNIVEKDISVIVKNLNSSKATTHKNIPIKIFKEHINVYIKEVTNIFNNMIDNAEFPDSFKRPDVTPVYKKGDTSLLNNYRPISVLPTLSKLIEKL